MSEALPHPGELAAIAHIYRIICDSFAQVEEFEKLHRLFREKLQCDEAVFGRIRHSKDGWNAAGKMIGFGIMKRNGHVENRPMLARATEEVIGLPQRKDTSPSNAYSIAH